jgi:hypothetical protein
MAVTASSQHDRVTRHASLWRNEMAANIFEAKAEICYCVPNGAAACSPCWERRAAKSLDVPISAQQFRSSFVEIKGVDLASGRDETRQGMIFDGKFIPDTVLNTLCMDSPCPNCRKAWLKTHHTLDGCNCHINPPCSYCTEQSLFCPICDFFLEIPDA